MAADTAEKILRMVLEESSVEEFTDLSKSIVLAAATGVKCGREMISKTLMAGDGQ